MAQMETELKDRAALAQKEGMLPMGYQQEQPIIVYHPTTPSSETAPVVEVAAQDWRVCIH